METIKIRESIKEKFLIEAIEHGKAISEGNYKKANRVHKRLQTLYDKAKECNQADLFSEFLNEFDENIKLWAATFTLKIYPDIAEKTLKDLSNLTTITGLSAKTTLDLWKQGMLNLL